MLPNKNNSPRLRHSDQMPAARGNRSLSVPAARGNRSSSAPEVQGNSSLSVSAAQSNSSLSVPEARSNSSSSVRKRTSLRRILLSACLLLLLSCSLLSCKVKQVVVGEIPQLTLDGKGKLTYAVDLDLKTFQEHTGQTVQLYRLEAGETLEHLAGKKPVAFVDVTQRLRISIPFTDENGTSSLYSSFIASFSDGKLVFPEPTFLANPGVLASNRDPFPHQNGIKGLNASNSSLSDALHATHTLLDLRLSELLSESGADLVSPALGTLGVNPDLLEETDSKIKSASGFSSQISLRIICDREISNREFALIADALSNRYSTAESGTVTAFLVDLSHPMTSQTEKDRPSDIAAAALRLQSARLALLSHVKNGRVYLSARGTYQAVKDTVTGVCSRLSASSKFPFAVALSPDSSVYSLLQAHNPDSPHFGTFDGDTPYFNLSDLVRLTNDLNEELGYSVRYCVTDVRFPAENQHLQSALYTYAYTASVQIKADFMIYRDLISDETGLYKTDLTPHLLAKTFRNADTAASTESELFASELISSDWKLLVKAPPARIEVSDVANPGTIGNSGDRFFDFTSDRHPPYFTVGRGTPPEQIESDLWGETILTSALSRSPEGSGYRFLLENGKDLQKLYAMSATLLPQTNSHTSAEITLRLDGTALNGKALSYVSSLTVTCNTWDTVTFHIRNFTSQMDPDAPCGLTLTMDPDTEDPEAPFALFLHSVNVREAASDYSWVIVTCSVVLGFGVGTLSVILIAKSQKKHRRH